MQRRLVFDALQRLPNDLPEQLPEEIRLRLRLPTRTAALQTTHFPPSDASLDELNRFASVAQRRLMLKTARLSPENSAA